MTPNAEHPVLSRFAPSPARRNRGGPLDQLQERVGHHGPPTRRAVSDPPLIDDLCTPAPGAVAAVSPKNLHILARTTRGYAHAFAGTNADEAVERGSPMLCMSSDGWIAK